MEKALSLLNGENIVPHEAHTHTHTHTGARKKTNILIDLFGRTLSVAGISDTHFLFLLIICLKLSGSLVLIKTQTSKTHHS